MRKKTREEINSIHDAVYHLRTDLNNLEGTVECEICGCLLKRFTAFKGKGKIRVKKTRLDVFYGDSASPNYGQPVFEDKEYVFVPYYCKSHVPAEEGK